MAVSLGLSQPTLILSCTQQTLCKGSFQAPKVTAASGHPSADQSSQRQGGGGLSTSDLSRHPAASGHAPGDPKGTATRAAQNVCAAWMPQVGKRKDEARGRLQKLCQPHHCFWPSLQSSWQKVTEPFSSLAAISGHLAADSAHLITSP